MSKTMTNGITQPDPRSDDTKFPVSQSCFPKVDISKSLRQKYEAMMKQSIVDALKELDEHDRLGANPRYGTPWRCVGKVESLSAFVKKDPNKQSTSLCRIFGNIKGDFRNFIEFYYADNNKDLYDLNKFMFSDTVDAQVLQNISTETEEEPYHYLGIKCVVYQPVVPILSKRDNCYLEYMGFTTDKHGREVGFRATYPIEIPESPDRKDTMKLAHVKSKSVYVVREAPGQWGVMKIYYTATNDFGENYVNNTFYKRHMNIMRNMVEFIDSKRISRHRILGRNNWVPDSARKECNVCSRSFHTTRFRHHCRLCGEVICKKCLVVRSVSKFDGQKANMQLMKKKFCIICVTRIRKKEDNWNFSSITASQKLSSMKMDDTNRYSCWSETESETSKVSTTAGEWNGENSFVTRVDNILQLIQSPVNNELENEEIIDTSEMQRCTSTGSKNKYMLLAPGSADSRMSDHHHSFHHQEAYPSCREINISSTKITRRELTNLCHQPCDFEFRTLDERIAEQEALLRRMAIVAGGYRRSRDYRYIH
jgi:hypothetical protein